jgi:hypothetical protein
VLLLWLLPLLWLFAVIVGFANDTPDYIFVGSATDRSATKTGTATTGT